MDNLAREAMMEKQAGMSYGRWKAMHYDPTKAAPVKAEKPKSEYEVTCLYCVKTFIKADKRKRLFCDDNCGDRYRYRKKCAKAV